MKRKHLGTIAVVGSGIVAAFTTLLLSKGDIKPETAYVYIAACALVAAAGVIADAIASRG